MGETAKTTSGTRECRHNKSGTLKDTRWPTVAGRADRHFVERASSRICGKSCPALSFNASVPALPSHMRAAQSGKACPRSRHFWRGSRPKQHACCATSFALLRTPLACPHAHCSPRCALRAHKDPVRLHPGHAPLSVLPGDAAAGAP